MNVSRRQFFKVTAADAGATGLAVMGVMPENVRAEVRRYRLFRATETRNNCTYCSVGCGAILYSMGDGARSIKKMIFHIEGDPDYPVSRGSLCPKGASLLDFVHSPNRVHYPEVCEPFTNEWKRISWHDALIRIAKYTKAERDANLIVQNENGTPAHRLPSLGVLTASASSNETGILTQKWMRSLGIVATGTQTRMCHGPTVSALASTFGRGAMTDTFVDIQRTDFIMVMGGNTAEAHPVGFKWVIEAKKKEGTKLFVVDPHFSRTASVADLYAPIRSDSDITFSGTLINWLTENDKIQWEYVKAYTNASSIVSEGFGSDDGIFSGYDEGRKKYDNETWYYELDENGYAKTDLTLQYPRCVFQLLKRHYSHYTLDVMNTICGTSKEDFLKVAEVWGEMAAPDKAGTILYALDWTQHTTGSQIIRTMAMVQLLLGNIGMSGGGVSALRGHFSIQGLSGPGLLSTSLPGYLNLPNEFNHPTFRDYIAKNTPESLQPNQLSYWGNTPAFFVSFLEWMYGENATKENNWGYDWLPEWDKMYDILQLIELMYQGKVNSLLVQGFNAQGSFPDAGRVIEVFSKLKFMVVMDPLRIETASLWENHGEAHNVDPLKIQTEVFHLPTPCFAEEAGPIANSSRWLQWHHPGAEPPGEALPGLDISGELHMIFKEMYEKEDGTAPEPITKPTWHHKNPDAPTPEEIAKESDDYALADLTGSDGSIIRKKGELLDGLSQLRDDGTTKCIAWIFPGSQTQVGSQIDRRDNTDSGLGNTPKWAWV